MFPIPFFDPSMFLGAAMPAAAAPAMPPPPVQAAPPPMPTPPPTPPMTEMVPNMGGPTSMSPSQMPTQGGVPASELNAQMSEPGMENMGQGTSNFMSKIQQANDQGAYRNQAAQRALKGLQNKSQTPQKKQAPTPSMNAPTTEAQRRAQAGGAPTLEYKSNISQDLFGGEAPPWMDPNKPLFG